MTREDEVPAVLTLIATDDRKPDIFLILVRPQPELELSGRAVIVQVSVLQAVFPLNASEVRRSVEKFVTQGVGLVPIRDRHRLLRAVRVDGTVRLSDGGAIL